MNKYPDYVKKYKPKGTIIKKVNDTFYVYEATSKRVEGKKYPVQVIKGVIGKIDKYGFHSTEKVKVSNDVFIRECGFTNYILLFKETFINDFSNRYRKKDREIILNSIICYLSPNSYLLENNLIIYSIDELIDKYKISLTRQISLIERVIEIELKAIEELKYICRVYIGDKELKSTLNKKQKEIIQKLGVEEDDVR
jgi:hypothetical protein